MKNYEEEVGGGAGVLRSRNKFPYSLTALDLSMYITFALYFQVFFTWHRGLSKAKGLSKVDPPCPLNGQ